MPEKSKSHDLKKGQCVEVEIISHGATGEGVAKLDGIAIFVDGTAIGDIVEAELYDIRKNFALGKIKSLKSASPNRITPLCPVFDECGGCHWQHIDYTSQLLAKQATISDALIRIGQQSNLIVEPVVPSELQTAYRNKAQFPLAKSKSRSAIQAGYYKKKSHELIDIEHCPVQPDRLDHVLKMTKEALHRYRLSVYDEKKHAGLLRHICMRTSMTCHDVLLTLVINSRSEETLHDEETAALEAISIELQGAIPYLSGICLNFNPQRGNRIMGEDTVLLRGSSQIIETLRSSHADAPALLKKGLRFELSPDSFFQINTAQAEKMLDYLFSETRALRADHGIDSRFEIVDAFAGVGTIAQFLSFQASRVIAVEVNSSATQDGIASLELNGIKNVEYMEMDAAEALRALATPREQNNSEKPSIDLVVLDPPRKGVEPEVIEAILNLAAPYLIYVSCNPSTLARDLALLEQGMLLSSNDGKEVRIGYRSKRLKPFDLFPQTYHVETVVTLERFLENGSIGNMETI